MFITGSSGSRAAIRIENLVNSVRSNNVERRAMDMYIKEKREKQVLLLAFCEMCRV